jgi:branched-chain amino acid transport system ATP-binding protein
MSDTDNELPAESAGTTTREWALDLHCVEADYGSGAVLHGVDLQVAAGETVALLGANGAGKSTLLRVAAGLVRPSAGSVSVFGEASRGWSVHKTVEQGVCLLPEGAGIFRSLSVRENLLLQIPKWLPEQTIEPAVEAFPVLGNRLAQTAGSLSGGEQRQLALSRAFLSKPRVVLADEMSLGLAPLVVDAIFAGLTKLAGQGMALVIVEQYAQKVLAASDRAYLLTRGSMQWSGPAGDLEADEIGAAYLGG